MEMLPNGIKTTIHDYVAVSEHKELLQNTTNELINKYRNGELILKNVCFYNEMCERFRKDVFPARSDYGMVTMYKCKDRHNKFELTEWSFIRMKRLDEKKS